MRRRSNRLQALAAVLAAALACPPLALATPAGLFAGTAEASSETADFLYRVAVEYLATGRLEEARHELRKLLILYPDDERARRLLRSLDAEQQSVRERAMQAALAAGEQALSESRAESRDAREQAMLEALSQAGRPPGPPGIPQPEPPSLRAPEPTPPRPSAFDPIGRFNQALAPLRISGEVRSTAGVMNDDLLFWEANGDLNERNFRVLFGNFRYNTFDPRLFSRLRVNLDTPEREGWQLHSNVTVDPWSFVGTTHKVTVLGDTPTDQVELQLKWWSATNTVINETFLTANNGDAIATPEIEIVDGKTVPTSVTSTFGNVFDIPAMEIDYTFQPIRWFWTGYQTDEVDFRIFPLALEDQALTSDDPLQLSNHHIYWEPSPWLDQWQPGEVNEGASPLDFTRGEWSDDLSFFTRDSDLTRLTALRGTSLRWLGDGGTTLQTAIASPKGLWEEYSSVENVLGMARLTHPLVDDRLRIGGLVTSRWGYHERRLDASNYVYSLDASATPFEGATVETQGAVSRTHQDRTGLTERQEEGWAWHTAVEQAWWGERLTSRLFYTHMDDTFDPGLASYRQTRDDQFWGRHLRFKRPLRLVQAIAPEGALTEYDFDAVRIGDGVDVGRDVLGLRVTGAWWDGRLSPLFDLRNVHTTDGKYVETVFRNENVVRPSDWFTGKTLFLYHDLPDTITTLDPHIVDDDLNTPILDSTLSGGLDPSLMTFSVGGEIALSEDVAFWTIWERTTDVTRAYDNFPRGLLNDTSFVTFNDEGTVIREELPFLYSQGHFPRPPYPWFDIYKAGVYVSPIETMEFAVDWTRNEYKFAGQIDDNLNHVGLTTAWSPVRRLVVVGRYVASWAVDITRLNAGETNEAAFHQSLYGQLRWLLSDDSFLSLEYGVAALAAPATLFSTDPVGDFYPTLDTVHLVRVLYNNEF